MTTSKIKTILFDLDGTLLDTARDLGAALTRLLQLHDQPTLAFDAIRPSAGRGAKGLLKLGFNIDDTDARYPALRDQFLNFYHETFCDSTVFFPGIEKVLTYLDDKSIPWGIVTNKPRRFTTELTKRLHLAERASCIISGDSLDKHKPHPEPILHACRLLSCLPQECIYLGDAEVDMIASKAAGTFSVVAMYGYILQGENPRDWNADEYIHAPGEILQFI